MRRRVRIALLGLGTGITAFIAVRDASTTYHADRLCEAIHAEDVSAVEQILEEGIDPMWKNSYGKTGLRVAQQHPNLEVLEAVEEAAGIK